MATSRSPANRARLTEVGGPIFGVEVDCEIHDPLGLAEQPHVVEVASKVLESGMEQRRRIVGAHADSTATHRHDAGFVRGGDGVSHSLGLAPDEPEAIEPGGAEGVGRAGHVGVLTRPTASRACHRRLGGMTTTAPFGSWASPISSDLLVAGAVRLGQLSVAGDDVYWVEGRPEEAGRQVLVRRTSAGDVTDLVPPGFGVRTLAHEYGGLAYGVAPDGSIYFSNFEDQRVYRIDPPAGAPVAITAEPSIARSVRYADHAVSPDGLWLLCVRERHLGASATEVVNDIVVLSLDDDASPTVVAEGHDFFAAPRWSPDGRSLCWLQWDHPDMPWDATVLCSASFEVGSTGHVTVADLSVVAGGPGESVSQPRWSPSGELHFASDRTGWWNLYRAGAPVAPDQAEFSGPDWIFGQHRYDFAADGTLVTVRSVRNLDEVGVVGADGFRAVESRFTSISALWATDGGDLVALAASPREPGAVVRFPLAGGRPEVLKRSRTLDLDAAVISVAEAIEYPVGGGDTAHAFFYAPTNPDFVGPVGEQPPLIVLSHGGPTSATTSALDVGIQFWTSRGFAVVDVNYGGSTGYGRAYRDRLRGSWGVVDVDDCVGAARWLAAEGRVDGHRLLIRGGSAGGYTTLAALTFRNDFAAGASHYGVADAEALAADTHKFESRYLDGLMAPYPEGRDVYVARSPIHHTHLLDRPMILFQGLEDEVVPPIQAEMMAGALRDKGIPFAYLAFEGEQHGFRKAETIKRVADAELWFYGRVLGFTPAGEIEPVVIENEDGLG